MEERAIKKNIRLAEVIAEANYADQKMARRWQEQKQEQKY